MSILNGDHRLVGLDAEDVWMTAIAGLPVTPCHGHGYNQALPVPDGDRIRLYHYRSDRLEAAFTLIDRPAIGGLAIDGLEGAWRDWTMPYGTGGLVLRGDPDDGAAVDGWWVEMMRFMADSGYVSGFLRVSPGQPIPPGTAGDALTGAKNAFVVDLRGDEADLFRRFGKNNRRLLRRWQGEGHVIERDQEALAGFMLATYPLFADRMGVAASYRFDRDTLARICALPQAWLLGVRQAGQITFARLHLVQGAVAEAFLECRTEKSDHHSRAIYWEAMNECRAAGRHIFHLGAGIAAGDSIEFFKRSLGGEPVPLRHARLVFDMAGFQTLCRAAGVAPDAPGLFPPYRLMETVPAPAPVPANPETGGEADIAAFWDDVGITADDRAHLIAQTPLSNDYFARITGNLRRRSADRADCVVDLCGLLHNFGRPDLAIDLLRRLDPAVLGEKCLFQYNYLLQFLPEATAEDIFLSAQAVGRRIAPTPLEPFVFQGDRSPDARLVIGHICAFFDSSVMRGGMLPTLAAFDRSRTRIVAYADGGNFPEALRHCVDDVHDVAGLDNAALVRLVRGHGVHVMRDLTGYATDHRLNAIAARLAPIQIHGANVAATSGIAQFDYVLNSATSIPPEEDAYFTERIVRDPYFIGASVVRLCDRPDIPDIAPPPVLENGYVTFSYFSSLHKANPMIAGLWARILERTPGSRLIFRSWGFEHASFKSAAAMLLARQGIDRSRCSFEGPIPNDQLLRAYAGIDIALDAFPYSGGSTMRDALWQGVPVIALAGSRWSARLGPSFLRSAGLPELAADTPDDYVDRAVALAHDPDRLRTLRFAMRDRIMASPFVTDRVAFASRYEAACRSLWLEYLKSSAGIS